MAYRLVRSVVAGMFFLGFLATGTYAQDNSPELPSNIEQRGKLIVATYCDYPPFGFVGDDGKPQGIDVDLAHKLAEYAFGDSNAVSFECTRSANRIAYLQTRKVDVAIAVLGITPTRAKVVDFTKPYFASTSVFLAKEGNEFESVQDLRGETLLVSSGTPWVPWLQRCEPEIRLGQYANKTKWLAALDADRGVAVLNDSTMLYPVAARDDKYVITGPNVKQQGYAWGFGVRKGNDAMLNWLNDKIDQMQSEDVFWSAVKRWQTNPEILGRLESVVRRPGHTPDYSAFEASQTATPSCP